MPKIRSKPLQARFQQSKWFHQTHEYEVPCWDFDTPEIAVQRKVKPVLFPDFDYAPPNSKFVSMRGLIASCCDVV